MSEIGSEGLNEQEMSKFIVERKLMVVVSDIQCIRSNNFEAIDD